MKVPVAVVLAALGCVLAEGATVSKCQLKEQLVQAIGGLLDQKAQRGLGGENLVAKIVCYAEHSSGFVTSVVTELAPGDEGRRPVRNQTKPRPKDSNEGSSEESLLTPRDEKTWTLYGLFQLTDHLVCSDGENPSPNLCDIDCSYLLDDDISDDVRCLLKILTNLLDKGFGASHWEELKTVIRSIFPEECREVKASEYFAECA